MLDADLTLPLFAEGLATYVSGLLSRGYSDGQLLLQNELGAIPVSKLPMVATRFLADADQNAVDPSHPEAFARWFMGAKADHQPDLPNRTGYWLGLNLVRQMRQQYSLREMASWPAAKAQAQARAALYEMTRGPGSGA